MRGIGVPVRIGRTCSRSVEIVKILLVSDFVPPVRGGLEYHVSALAAELAARGHEVRVATLTLNPDPIPGVTIHSVAALSRYLPHEFADRPFHIPTADPFVAHSLASIIDEFEPDVIHGHSAAEVSVPRRVRTPLVITAHDYSLICVKRTLLHGHSSICSGPKVGKCVPCAGESRGVPISAALTLATIAGRRRLHPAAVLAVSSAVRTSLQPYFAQSIEVVPNFIPAEPERVTPFAGLPDSGFALYAGDRADHKGIPDLLEIWSAGPAMSLPLVLATTRPVETTLPDGVVNVSLTKDEVAYAWQRATVGVVPSWWADPCPTVALEALRAGVPVVAYAVGGLTDLIRDDIDGFLVPPRDRTGLRARISDIGSDEVLRARLSAAAHQGATAFFAGPVIDDIEAVYRRVVVNAEAAVAG